MMKLLLISPQDVYATKRMVEEVDHQGIALTIMDIAELVERNYGIDPINFDALYIRQAYTEFQTRIPQNHLQGLVDLARRFQAAGKSVVDRTIAQGDIGRGKFEALQRLREQGMAIPQTRLLSAIPETELHFPLIAKWNYGFGAKHTYLIETLADLGPVRQKYASDQIMVQEFVRADFEYKAVTVGYKSLPVIIKLKTNHNRFLPDLNNYEALSAAAVPEVISLAEKAAQVLERELAKVDILEDGTGRLYVLEVNRWPGLWYFEQTTKYNVAASFLAYLGGVCKKSKFPL